MNCQLKKGILRQRACNNPATKNCAKCGIEVCDQHSQVFENRILCLNCLSKEQNLNSNFAYNRYLRSDSDMDFYLWYWYLRSEYDNEYGIESFDEGDYEGFIADESSVDFDSDVEQDDFLDS